MWRIGAGAKKEEQATTYTVLMSALMLMLRRINGTPPCYHDEVRVLAVVVRPSAEAQAQLSFLLFLAQRSALAKLCLRIDGSDR